MAVLLDYPAGPAEGESGDWLRFMRRVAIAMFLVGGLTCALGLLKPHSTAVSQMAQGACAASFVLCGLLLAATRVRRRSIEASLLVSILILSVLTALSDPIGMGPLFYLWPVVFAAYFCSRRILIASFAWMTITLAVGLAFKTHYALKFDTFTGTVSSVGLMAGLVATMRWRESGLRTELAQIAETDPLTGLLNRRAFDPRLAGLMHRTAHGGEELAVVMFDIDYFKRFNDEHGHLAGDQALRQMAAVLQKESRNGDLVARLGGEEFAVALPGAGIGAARAYAERVARALRSGGAESGPRLSTSAGISPRSPDLGDVEALVAHADQALYAAKAAGRARAAWWEQATIVVGAKSLPEPRAGSRDVDVPTVGALPMWTGDTQHRPAWTAGDALRS
jgi:diguanylate cyclase (GGDEF)-like protein